MDDSTPPHLSGEIRGFVVAVPANRRIPHTLVRFFEFHGTGHLSAKSGHEWILDNGTPIGSTVTNDRGEFRLPYCSPKGQTALAFVVFGPETAGKCEVLSWSYEPRPISATNEVFLIGVNESRLLTPLHGIELGTIDRFVKSAEQRRAVLTPAKRNVAPQWLRQLRWAKTASVDEISIAPGFHIESSAGPEAARELNKKILREDYENVKGGLKLSAVPLHTARPKGPVNKKLQLLNKGSLGLAVVNVYSEVGAIVDRLRPAMTRRRKEAAVQAKLEAEQKKGAAVLPALKLPTRKSGNKHAAKP